MIRSIRNVRGRAALAGGLLGALTLAGCAGGGSGGGGSADIPSELEDDVTISFWHVYQGADQEAIDALIAEFEDQYPNIDVEVQFTGGFAEQNQKIVSGLQAGDPPNVAIAYPSNVLDYQTSKAVLNLSPYITNGDVGLTDEELEDIFPIQRIINRYEVADGEFLSFPFTANVMVLYYNADMLKEVGIEAPPATWDEFEDQCEVIKQELDLPCFSARGDGSSMNGIAGAFGGHIMNDDGAPAVDSPEWTEALQTLGDLAEAGYVEVAGGGNAQVTGPDLQSFVSERAAFILGTSRNIGFFPDAIGGTFDWRAAPPPQVKPTDDPVTVLYGPGVVAFENGTEEDLASWLLIKYLSSTETQEQWAIDTGQLPVRASVAESPEFQAKLDENPASAVAFDLMPDTVWDGALGDNGVIKTISDEERELLASVMNAVLLGDMTPEEGGEQLQQGFGS